MIRTDTIEELRARLAALAPIHSFSLRLGTTVFTITTARDVDALIDRISDDEFRVDERLPYWATVWHSAVALGQFLLTNPQLVSGRSVLEIGCGLGVAGIAAARCGARVTFSDNDPHALLAARLNASENAVGNGAEFLELDFRNTPPRRWPVVLAADVIYEKRFLGPVADFLGNALEPDGCAIIAEPDRAIAGPFFAQLVTCGFSSRRFTQTAWLEGRSIAVSIHLISRSRHTLETAARSIPQSAG